MIRDAIPKILLRVGNRIVRHLKDKITKADLVDTGFLRNSFRAELRGQNKLDIITAAPYYFYHDSGTGIYNPRRREPIRPRRAPYMVFYVKDKATGRRRLVRAREVRGVPARHFTDDAMKFALRELEKEFVNTLGREIAEQIKLKIKRSK